MLAKERQSAMREIIRRDGRATIADLARRFNVTTETVRRDLSLLSQKEPIRRIHGGAVLLPPVQHEFDLEERKMSFPNEKRAIGALAAGLLSDGDSVDDGSVEAMTYIFLYQGACPNSKIILAGYSQGAQVVAWTKTKVIEVLTDILKTNWRSLFWLAKPNKDGMNILWELPSR